MAEKKVRFRLAREHPKTAVLVAGLAAASIIGWVNNDGETAALAPAPPAAPAPAVPGAQLPEGVMQGVQGPNAPKEPPFDAAAGEYNKAHLEGRVRCNVTVSRGAGAITVAGAVNQDLRGIWYSYTLSSQRGNIRGWGQGAAIAINDPANVAGGKMSRLRVQAHYPYGDGTPLTSCDLNGAGGLAAGIQAPEQQAPVPAGEPESILVLGNTRMLAAVHPEA